MFVVIPEYQRAVFFRFGRVKVDARGPGILFRIPIVDKVVRVNSGHLGETREPAERLEVESTEPLSEERLDQVSGGVPKGQNTQQYMTYTMTEVVIGNRNPVILRARAAGVSKDALRRSSRVRLPTCFPS